MSPNQPLLAIVIPCFNEEDLLPEIAMRMKDLIAGLISEEKVSGSSYVLFVDDGSTDNSWAMIQELVQQGDHNRGLKLSRNFGHQPALLAGLEQAIDADVIITIDADLQDDINAIPLMIDKYSNAHCDIVYGVRNDRSSDSFFKRRTAHFFYRLLARMGVESVYNHADFRLLSRKALHHLLEFREINLYLRGLVPKLGFKQVTVYYDRGERTAGKSKYGFRKMLSFAWNGITSLSVKPLHFVTFWGFIIFLGSIVLTMYAIISWLTGRAVPGWSSTVIPIYFLGGIQLLSIGLIGEYVGKMYQEVKGRPRFIVEAFVKKEESA